jgi:prephenate dehydrogenase
MPAPRALIAGLGLIGGSIGIPLRARGWRVAYVDPNVDLHEAQRTGAADERVYSLDAPTDVIVIATPVDVAIELLRAQGSGLRTTSVASVMEPLKAAAKNANFIAGHPLAGSQERGLAAARADLLRDRVWFLERHDELIDRMVRDCGARVEIVGAKEHDAAVALTSHLPQLLSTALAAYLDQHGIEERFVGSGLRTFLRLAGSDASVWLPVIEANRANIAPHVDAVSKVVRAILDGDSDAFERAQQFWSRLQ